MIWLGTILLSSSSPTKDSVKSPLQDGAFRVPTLAGVQKVCYPNGRKDLHKSPSCSGLCLKVVRCHSNPRPDSSSYQLAGRYRLLLCNIGISSIFTAFNCQGHPMCTLFIGALVGVLHRCGSVDIHHLPCLPAQAMEGFIRLMSCTGDIVVTM